MSWRANKIAVARPAVPAPIMAIFLIFSLLSIFYFEDR
jgi:hypothetical protein